jgi:hypothetical protein
MALKRLPRAPSRVAYEVGAIALEMLRIPLRLCLRIAEIAGAAVLPGWRMAWPPLLSLARGSRRLVAVAARAAKPARGAITVSLGAAIALLVSQFVDYRAVEIGAPQYHAVAGVAPPPSVGFATPRSAHGTWMIAIAIAALVVVAVAIATRRGRYGLLLVPLAAAAVVIAIAVDSPKGLETGQAGIAYQGARATLLEGYGAEIAAAGALGVSGLLLAVYLPAAARRRRGRRPARARVRAAGERRVVRAAPRRASA